MIRVQVRSDQLAQIAKLASNGQVEVHVQAPEAIPFEWVKIGTTLLPAGLGASAARSGLESLIRRIIDL